MALITQYAFWADLLTDNRYLNADVLQDGETHRQISAYDEDPLKTRVMDITNLLRGNEADIIAHVEDRKTVLEVLTRADQDKRLKIIGNKYFSITDRVDIDMLDDDIFHAWMKLVEGQQTSIGIHLAKFESISSKSRTSQLKIVRWGLVNYVYEIVIKACNLSKVPEFRKSFFGFPVKAEKAGNAGIAIISYQLLTQMVKIMSTPVAISLFTGLPTLLGFLRVTKFKLSDCFNWVSSWFCRTDYHRLENVDTAEEIFIDLDKRPLTEAEKKARAKRYAWEISILINIYLVALKIGVQTYTNDTFDEFVNRVSGGTIPPGNSDYFILSMQSVIIQYFIDYLNSRKH